MSEWEITGTYCYHTHQMNIPSSKILNSSFTALFEIVRGRDNVCRCEVHELFGMTQLSSTNIAHGGHLRQSTSSCCVPNSAALMRCYCHARFVKSFVYLAHHHGIMFWNGDFRWGGLLYQCARTAYRDVTLGTIGIR